MHVSYSNRSQSGSRSSSGQRPRNFRKQGSNGGGRKASTLNPSLFVKKGSESNAAEFKSERLVSELPISEALRNCLIKKGFERPTEIQDRTLEALLDGRNLLGIAQTGTGKTGAFLIPIIEQIMHSKQKNYALVVVPTRELALQVEDEFRSMSKGLGLFSACFIGGTNINKDLQTLRRPTNIVIGTPGRLLDLVQRRMLDLRKFNTLVLDEFDRMLDMGFINDVKLILSEMKQRQQTLLFSATIDNKQKPLIDQILTNPVTVKVSTGETTGDHIDQDVVKLQNGENKFTVLHKMISNDEFQKVLVFEETKHQVAKLCKQLNQSGIESLEIHGNKSQGARQSALKAFKTGRIRVLVATDVAARGIDVSDVTHVINYQIPQTYDSYIHRIGRTGRAGKKGKAFTFVD